MTATASGSSPVVAVLNPVKASIATTSRPFRQISGRCASQVLKACLERPSTMSSSREGPVRSRIGVRSMMTVTYLSPRRVWRQMNGPPQGAERAGIVDANDRDAVEAVRVVDEDALALDEDRVVGGVPGHGQGLGDPGDGEVLDHQPFQRPAQRPAGQPRPRFRGPAGVLAPDVPAAGALVAAHRDQQCRRSPAQRLMGKPSGHAVARRAFAAATPAPLIGLDDPAGEDRSVRVKPLFEDLETELVEAAERGQVGAGEVTVRHVEVFLDGQRENFHLGRPRPLPGHRRAARYVPLTTPSFVMSQLTATPRSRQRSGTNGWPMSSTSSSASDRGSGPASWWQAQQS